MNSNFSFSMMMVALVIAMSIGFTACKDDKEEPEKVYNMDYILHKKWVKQSFETGSLHDLRYSLEFKGYEKDYTYTYISPDESVNNGNLRIFETKHETGLVSSEWTCGREVEAEREYTLFKMYAAGSRNFDQMWVYYVENRDAPRLYVHFYSPNVPMRKIVFKLEDTP
jgi:hypothetical protein